MKKTATFLLAVSMCAAMGVGLSSCSKDTTGMTNSAEAWEEAFEFNVHALEYKATSGGQTISYKITENALFADTFSGKMYLQKLDDACYSYTGRENNGEIEYVKSNITKKDFLQQKVSAFQQFETLTQFLKYRDFTYNAETKKYEAEDILVMNAVTDCSVVIEGNKVVKIEISNQDEGITTLCEFFY